MSDATARFKQFLWDNYAINPQAVVVNVVNDRVASFGVDGNSGMTRAMAFGTGAHAGKNPHMPRVVQFEGYGVPETEFDGTGGAQASGHVPHGMRRS